MPNPAQEVFGGPVERETERVEGNRLQREVEASTGWEDECVSSVFTMRGYRYPDHGADSPQ